VRTGYYSDDTWSFCACGNEFEAFFCTYHEATNKANNSTIPTRPRLHCLTFVGSGNSEPLIPEILSRSALEGETSPKV
jgi:hypothetical protein